MPKCSAAGEGLGTVFADVAVRHDPDFHQIGCVRGSCAPTDAFGIHWHKTHIVGGVVVGVAVPGERSHCTVSSQPCQPEYIGVSLEGHAVDRHGVGAAIIRRPCSEIRSLVFTSEAPEMVWASARYVFILGLRGRQQAAPPETNREVCFHIGHRPIVVSSSWRRYPSFEGVPLNDLAL